MKHIHYSNVKAQHFEGDIVKGVTGRIAIGKEDQANNFCMRIFTIEPGGFTPKHSHPWEHEIFIHQGEGLLLQDGEYMTVVPGDVIFIPGNEEHQFKNKGVAPFVFVCLVPREAPEL